MTEEQLLDRFLYLSVRRLRVRIEVLDRWNKKVAPVLAELRELCDKAKGDK